MSEDRRFEVNEDLDFQRRTWSFERIGWAVMGAIIAAALAGLLGPGPLSNVKAGDARLHVEYERFLRSGSPAMFKVRIGRAAVRDDEVALLLDEAFVETFDIERVVPRPAQWQLVEEGVRLRFPVADLGALATIRLYLRPLSSGPARVGIGLADGPPITLQPMIYP